MSLYHNCGAFASAALELREKGLAVLPCAGEDGKRPLIGGFGKWSNPPPLSTVTKWRTRYPTANVAAVLGPASQACVLDVDDPERAQAALSRYPTPLVVRTPRNGAHLWFKWNGEASANLRRANFPGDLQAKGRIVVVPPSSRPGVGAYEIVRGDWGVLGELPPVPREILDLARPAPSPRRLDGYHRERIVEGERNDWLYRELLYHAPHCDDLDALIDKATWLNECCVPRLSDAEVVKTARSAWRTEIEGRNWAYQRSQVSFTRSELADLDPDSCYLLALLRATHSPGDVFAVSPKPFGKALRWCEARVRRALYRLLPLGHVEMFIRGGRGKGDPHLYTLPVSARNPRTISIDTPFGEEGL